MQFRPRDVILVISMAIATAACAVGTPPEIKVSQGSAQTISSVTLISSDDEATQRASLAQSLRSAFQQRSVEVADNAPMIADFAIANSSGEVELAIDPAGGEDKTPQVKTVAVETSILDTCKPVRTRVTLALFDRESGNLVRKSEAESTSCPDDPLPFEAFAELLVGDVVSD